MQWSPFQSDIFNFVEFDSGNAKTELVLIEMED